MSMWTRGFWKATAERVIASTAGGALTVMGNELFNVLELDVQQTMGIALGAGLVSLLKSLATGTINGTASASASEIPSDSVVEKVVDHTIVAGPANDMEQPGKPIRAEHHDAEGNPL